MQYKVLESQNSFLAVVGFAITKMNIKIFKILTICSYQQKVNEIEPKHNSW